MRDPQDRTITQQWCECGSLDKLIDGSGNVTRWEYDVLGRVTKQIRADTSETQVTYESTISRVKKVRDSKNQDTNLFYNRDDSLQQVTFTNAVIPTPSVSFTYDAFYPRPLTKTDGTGTTTYTYHPITGSPSVGAGQMATIDGPLPNDTIAYGYDELTRVVSEAVNGAAYGQPEYAAWSYSGTISLEDRIHDPRARVRE